MRAFAGCFILFVASTSVASAQSSELLTFGKGRPVPPGDVVAGQNIYNAVCWACHDRDLNGYKGPPLTGSTFYKIWQGRRADALSDLIRNRMPQDDPGWLSDKSAHDLVAYIVAYSNNPKSLTSGQTGK
ncbi:MAG: cytochrome c [Pseudomonadota bacterium]